MLTMPRNMLAKDWVTLEPSGTHVNIDGSGNVTAGPAGLTGRPVNNLGSGGKKPPDDKPTSAVAPTQSRPEKPTTASKTPVNSEIRGADISEKMGVPPNKAAAFVEAASRTNDVEKLGHVLGDSSKVLQAISDVRPAEHWGSKDQPYWRPGPNKTVDNVITRDGKDGPEVLMIRRKDTSPTEAGKWALPGGFHDSDAKKGQPWKEGKESGKEAAIRELEEEASLDLSKYTNDMTQVGEYNKRGRDPRDNPEAWSESTAFHLKLPEGVDASKILGSDDADRAEWVPLSKMGDREVAFDHKDIIRDATGGGKKKSLPHYQAKAMSWIGWLNTFASLVHLATGNPIPAIFSASWALWDTAVTYFNEGMSPQAAAGQINLSQRKGWGMFPKNLLGRPILKGLEQKGRLLDSGKEPKVGDVVWALLNDNVIVRGQIAHWEYGSGQNLSSIYVSLDNGKRVAISNVFTSKPRRVRGQDEYGPTTDWKSGPTNRLVTKAAGPCKPGQTAARTGCTPASRGGGKKPGGKDKPDKKPVPKKPPKATAPKPEKPKNKVTPITNRAPFGKSMAKVVVAKADKVRSEQLIGDLSKGKWGVAEAASLVGAPDGVKVNVSGHTTEDKLNVWFRGKGFSAGRTIEKDENGDTFIYNHTFMVDPKYQGQGLGADVFGKQVENAAKSGIAYIQCLAARSYSEKKGGGMNGYYTWPRFGYDQSFKGEGGAEFGEKFVREVKKKFPKAKSVLDVMASQEGRDWWKENGAPMTKAKFDLSEGSRSRKVFEAYLAERAAKNPGKSLWSAVSKELVEEGREAKGEDISLSKSQEMFLESAWRRFDLEEIEGSVATSEEPQNMPVNNLKSYITKAAGPCKPGMTAARTGCTPASRGGGKKPVGKPDAKKPVAKPKVSKKTSQPKPRTKAEAKKADAKLAKGGQIDKFKGFKSGAKLEATEPDSAMQQYFRDKFGTDQNGLNERAFARLGLKGNNIGELLGQPNDAEMFYRAGIPGDDGASEIRVSIEHPKYSAERYIDVDDTGNRFIHNETFFVKPEYQNEGLGASIFARQVATASADGISYIECQAAKGTDSAGNDMNGYYTWARFGYDQGIDKFDRADQRKILKVFPRAKSVLDVMKSKKGRDWWKANGMQMDNAKFDLKPGSRSMKVLEAYLQEREAAGKPIKSLAWSVHKDARSGEGLEELPINEDENDALEAAWDYLDSITEQLEGGEGLDMPVNTLKSYVTKAAGPCKPGMTAARTGCTPASGSGKKKPPKEGTDKPTDPLTGGIDTGRKWTQADDKSLGELSSKVAAASKTRSGQGALGVPGLKKLAGSLGLKGGSKLKKADLVQAIQAKIGTLRSESGGRDKAQRLDTVAEAEKWTGKSFNDRVIDQLITATGKDRDPEWQDALRDVMRNPKHPKDSSVKHLAAVRDNFMKALKSDKIPPDQLEGALSGVANSGNGKLSSTEFKERLHGAKGEGQRKPGTPKAGEVLPPEEEMKLKPHKGSTKPKPKADVADYISRLREPLSPRLDHVSKVEELSGIPFAARVIHEIAAAPESVVAGKEKYVEIYSRMSQGGRATPEERRFMSFFRESVAQQIKRGEIRPQVLGAVLETMDENQLGTLKVDEFVSELKKKKVA